ncbi:MAG: hypothetical protein HQK77_00545 [Desulfobacterales bacterium]|nr:hypothetical protein [Desulfobacterales bacterium]
MKILRYIPLFIIILIVYNMMFLSGVSFTCTDEPIFEIPLMSKSSLLVLPGDFMLILSILVLYIEIFRATRTSIASIIDHSLSLLTFILFLIEFIVMPGASTSIFLIITLMSLLDVLAGFTITLSTAKRDIAVISQ